MAPLCNVQSTFLDFGSVNYSSSANRTIGIQNAGGGTLSGSITGAGVDFHFLDSPSFSLSAGQWAYIAFHFTPSSGGAQACTLQISPGGCSPIVCRGTGVLTYNADGAVSEACPVFKVVGSALFGLAPGGTQVRCARFTPRGRGRSPAPCP